MKDSLLTRGVEKVIPKDLADKKLKSGKSLRLYLGIDPTGSKLHLGHSVPLRKLKQFADAGHHVIFLVGSFTAMIGDPSGQDKMREPLTKEDVEKNFESYKEQASKILDFNKDVEVVYNHEWLGKLSSAEMLNLTTHFTVQQMSQRDMFDKRLKKGDPVSVQEFLYPTLVAYDSVVLDVDFEVGGSDQEFNMLCGRTLQEKYGKREKFVLTTKLIEGTDGRKMSKSYENCVYLDDEPDDMYGKLMSINDNLISVYMECCTDLAISDQRSAISGAKAKKLKSELAHEIVRMYHNEEAADAAVENFDKVHKDKGIPEDIPEIKIEKGTLLVDALVSSGVCKSKSEARRNIEQGGVKIDDETVSSVEAIVEGECVVKVGKRKFLKMSC
ncbi:tyrosine--tRNA ligase [Candidatus Peribacteria bacterium]|jgi:tyrosyl-tRNA synthetase|nr:tyrosine--tRNA ligase [Candidatus Peribacteria bacterium]MBT4021634.1 tyrosine--tRNA ligase [Candidatus Peribacteria bacterium]MBT4241081.1 tyrosine--tRNA ligase [Candidatus Peribacteria bacterium]MBT4474420.1 tyrosine--tRNA ligase [Candidatus Peribacteria bacterium]